MDRPTAQDAIAAVATAAGLEGAATYRLVVDVRDGALVYAEAWPIRVCRVCGCTDDRACEEGCAWVAEDLCSACEEDLD